MAEARDQIEEHNDQEFSILKKSIIPNLLDREDKFEEHNEPTFLTEVSDDEIEADLKDEEGVRSTSTVLDQNAKREHFKVDFDFRRTLVNEESFEDMKETEQHDAVDKTVMGAENSKLNLSPLDISAAVGGVVLVVTELLNFMM
eukprot:GFUD01018982.1.p1 GENE.GFUD01018982.1~~GFUD01018982.1.p1  ORF type:complete len:144 (+),score=59.94 GFUD01018982.1:160-591(+)